VRVLLAGREASERQAQLWISTGVPLLHTDPNLTHSHVSLDTCGSMNIVNRIVCGSRYITQGNESSAHGVGLFTASLQPNSCALRLGGRG
jgi:hypothetical protein